MQLQHMIYFRPLAEQRFKKNVTTYKYFFISKAQKSSSYENM